MWALSHSATDRNQLCLVRDTLLCWFQHARKPRLGTFQPTSIAVQLHSNCIVNHCDGLHPSLANGFHCHASLQLLNPDPNPILSLLHCHSLQAHFVECDPWVVSTVLSPNLAECNFSQRSLIHMTKVESFLERAEQTTGEAHPDAETRNSKP